MTEQPSSPTNLPPRKSSFLPTLCILGAGTFWGFTGLFNRLLSPLGISAPTLALVRNTSACILLALLFLVFDRSVFRIKLRHIPSFLAMGTVSMLLFTIAYFRSQQVSSLSVAAILLYTAPTMVVLLSAVLFHEKLTKKKLLALLITFLGCSFVTGVWNGGLSISLEGLFYGLASGLCYASYSIFGRFSLRHYKPFTVTFYNFLVAGLGSLFLIRPQELSLLVTSPIGIGAAVGLMVFGTVLPYILYTKGLNDMGDAGKASILASVEPVVASLVGVIAFGEPMGIGVILGLLCILISVYILR